MIRKNFLCQLAATAMTVTVCSSAIAQEMPGLEPVPEVKDDGTIITPSYELPFSSIASKEAREAYVETLRSPVPLAADLARVRQNTDDRMAPLIARAKEIYPVNSKKTRIGGVPVEIFTPKAGVAEKNKKRVLIEVHGGAFVAGGGGPGGAIESIPVVGEMQIKVIAVDYRLGPENRFPAASEDVAAVYQELLKAYEPENIGIYGCSAGGMLSAQAVAWFLDKGLPVPGAIGVFCASLLGFGVGDSAQLWPRMGSLIRFVREDPEEVYGPSSPYTAGQSVKNPLVVPGASREVLAQFPPTLILTGTRAPEMSGAAQSALLLQELGVEAQLSLFDGMDHGFFTDADLPESRVAYKLMADFFDRQLGKD